MTVQSYDLTHSDSGLLARAAAWVQDRFTDLAVARQNAKRLRELEALSDATLHDIGLSRSELTSIAIHRSDISRAR